MNTRDEHPTPPTELTPQATLLAAEYASTPTAVERPLHILVVEDSSAEIDDMLRALRAGGLEPKWERVETAAALQSALAAGPWDAVLSAYTLPGFGAVAALELVRASDPDLPFIVVSGAVGENAAVALMQATASDYILKHDMVRLAPTVERELREAGNRRAKRAAERAASYLAAVVDSSDDAIVSKTLDGVITTWNPAAERLYGWPRVEAVGRNVSFLVPPDKADEMAARIAQLLAGHPVGSFEIVRLHRDGRRIDVAMTLSRVRDAAGRLVGVSKTARDIQERRRAEVALRRSEERYRSLVTATAEIVWDSPPSGAFDTDQPQWTAFTGQTVEEHRGWGWLQAIHPDDRERSGAAWTAALLDRTPYQLEHRVRRGDGEYRQMSARAVPILDAVGAIREWVGVHTDVTERARAEEALRLRDRAIGAATQGLLITDPAQPDNPLEYVNPGFERLTGYAAAEALGRNCRFLQGPDTDPGAVAGIREAVRTGVACTVELLNYRKDGTTFWNELSISPVRDAAGRLINFVGVQVDVTARRSLEAQFRQAQKMEAFGQLAAGVAHDFNNLLTIINGYSDLLLDRIPPADPSHELVAEIHEAGERSAGLTRQLLAFSRQQVLAPRVMDLNAVVADTEKMLRRLLGEDVRLTATLAPNLGVVRADPGQVEQVLMNLAVNARDAMPTGGRLTIETRNVELDEGYARTRPDARPGPHVLLSVSDTGSGMRPEVLARVFEPFFTTKERGKGTGLGLATVFGIVRQSGGHVAVYSEVGIGTTMKVYLPRVPSEAGGSKVGAAVRVPLRGSETILLVEDDDGVRRLAGHVLTGFGYKVLEAADGAEAFRVVGRHTGPIHLLVTDVVMPGMSGRQVADRLAGSHPTTRVLYVSGYTDDAVLRHGILEEAVYFLPKPYSPAALATKVRDVLDAPVIDPG